MVEVLLRNSNVDVNKPGHFGRTPLHEAFYTSKAHPTVSEELVYVVTDRWQKFTDLEVLYSPN